MDKAQLAKVLNYPQIWLEANLFTDELFSIQAPEFQREYGGRVPSGGTEHWRYGAFHFWLKRNIDVAVLERLLDAATVDPDQPMAGAAIRYIVAHPSSDRSILARAIDAVSKSRDFYVSKEQLERAFEEKLAASP